MNGDMNRFPPATPGAYIFPRNNSQEVKLFYIPYTQKVFIITNFRHFR